MKISRGIALASARHMVTRDPVVAGGAATVAASGVPVALVTAMLERMPAADVGRALPALTARQVELCGLLDAGGGAARRGRSATPVATGPAQRPALAVAINIR